jgi:hypothetical protein
MVTKDTIRFINRINREKRNFKGDYGMAGTSFLSNEERLRFHALGLLHDVEIKDCIGWYILTHVDKFFIDYELNKIYRIKEILASYKKQIYKIMES